MADRQVLEVLAAPVAVAVHAVLLSQELQRSRERLVAAREEDAGGCAATSTTASAPS